MPDEREPLPARYDPIADGYARHWGPVIRPAALRVIDILAERIATGGWAGSTARGGSGLAGRARGRAGIPTKGGAGLPRATEGGAGLAGAEPLRHLVDVGTGTGVLAQAALARWPGVRVTGIDASREMILRAKAEAAAVLDPGALSRLDLDVALADRLPHADATFDAAVSSFVYQLVPDQAAALREALRVLRPGGWLVYATWIRDTGPLPGADRILEDVLDAFGFDPPAPDSGNGDAASPRAAADGLRRAGFRDVRATPSVIDHHWTPRSYAAFAEEFAEASLFDDLVVRERRDLRRRLISALGAAAPSELRMRLPIVYVAGRRPA